MDKTVLKHGNTKVTISEKEVIIDFGFKRIAYKAGTREYLNYTLLIGEENKEEQDLYLEGMIGIELLPSYAHSDPELASVLLNAVIEDFTAKLENIEVPEEDTLQEATDLLNMKLEHELQGKKSK